MKILRDLGASLSYFSILPIPHSDEPPNDGAIAWLPIVGLVIGALTGLGAYGIWLLTHSQIAAAITAWVLSIALSGAIHVDGFLDCCDGLFAMASPQRRLEIMRDPHHGTYAIVGMAMISLLWLYALAQVSPEIYSSLLPTTAFFARAWPAALRSRVALVMGVLVFVIAAKYEPARAVALSSLFAALVTAIVALFARRRLGGVLSGDCYGAAIVIGEVAMLLAYPALAALR